MNKRPATILIAATALALATTGLAGAGLADSATGDARSHPRPPEVIRLFQPESATTVTEVDLGEPGFGVGDRIIEVGPAVDPASGVEAGWLSRTVDVTEIHDDGDFSFVVQTTIELATGDIQYAGAARYSQVVAGKASGPITGGTGRYRRAGGVASGALGELNGEPGLHLRLRVYRSR